MLQLTGMQLELDQYEVVGSSRRVVGYAPPCQAQ
jgi:hypothetical protein